MKAYVRPSALPVAEFCPVSAELSAQSGISREAIMSTAWHAKLAGNDALIGALHPEDRKEVSSWGSPTDAKVGDVLLDYASAEKELHVQVFERDSLLTEGTLDFAWVREVAGRRWAFVADLKRSTWAVPDGPETLQLAAYGHAYANLRNCDGYTPGLWSGTDEEWSWGTPVDLTSPEALDLWLRLKRASRNDRRLIGDPDKRRPVTGAHCKNCYGRMRCDDWRSLWLDFELDGVVELGSSPTPEEAARALLAANSMAEHSERLLDSVKTYIARGGTVKDPTTGKVFLPTLCKGKKSLDQDALAKVVDLSKFQKQGKPYERFDWRKA